jgi:NAD(P)-dependent dehydrogenase (short-subunit alcohol dehydrogenase family)
MLTILKWNIKIHFQKRRENGKEKHNGGNQKMQKEISSQFSLEGKVAIITGASRGIGFGIASLYSKAGAKVVICSRNQAGIEEAASKIREGGGDVLSLAVNVSSEEERKKLVNAAMDWAGHIDILVNNAGTNPAFGPLAELSRSAWEKIFEVNLNAPFYISQLVYHAWMKDHGGVIINVASVGGFQTALGTNAYNVTKAALIHLTKCLASEWGHNGIRVNALAPGLIKTRLSKALWDNPVAEKVIETHPIPRFGTPEDIAGGALFLASDSSSFITGHILVIDGGQLVKLGEIKLE